LTTARPSPFFTTSSVAGYSRPFIWIGRSLVSRNLRARRPSISTLGPVASARTTSARHALASVPEAPSSVTTMDTPCSSTVRALSTIATRIVPDA